MLRAPFASEFDPVEEAEGSVDPLGLQPAYERLADRLLPAVTIRMGRARFVTAIAVGACICDQWGPDDTAADQVTPPWLVFEWLVIEAFARDKQTLSATTGIPGIQKVRRALTDKRPVSASSYLRTPGTFGFSGVFRRLALALHVITEQGTLGENGYRLVNAWAKDQRLAGIIESSAGDGRLWRDRVRRAVSQAMAEGQTTPQPNSFWQDLTSRFDPGTPGKTEASVLLDLILKHAGQVEAVGHLAKALIARNGVPSRDGEAPFLKKLSARSPTEMAQLLTGIDAYEAFARTITNAFNGVRILASLGGRTPLDAKTFSNSPGAKVSFAALAPSIAQIKRHPTLLDWEIAKSEFSDVLTHFDAVRSTTELFEAVLSHHRRVQDNKPPAGKRSWFEIMSGGRVVIRADYALAEEPDQQGFVHEYRVPTFSRFLSDLGAFS